MGKRLGNQCNTLLTKYSMYFTWLLHFNRSEVQPSFLPSMIILQTFPAQDPRVIRLISYVPSLFGAISRTLLWRGRNGVANAARCLGLDTIKYGLRLGLTRYSFLGPSLPLHTGDLSVGTLWSEIYQQYQVWLDIWILRKEHNRILVIEASTPDYGDFKYPAKSEPQLDFASKLGRQWAINVYLVFLLPLIAMPPRHRSKFRWYQWDPAF